MVRCSGETAPVTANETHTMKQTLLPLLRELALDLLDGKLYFNNYGPEAFCMRMLLAIGALQNYYREELPSRKPSLLKELVALIDQLRSCGLRDSRIEAFLRESIRELEFASADGLLQRSGWENEFVPKALNSIPTMLCPETMGYYKWLARTFSGVGDIVELGCWMGCSTCCLAEGLLQNPDARSRKIHVFDSFVWLDWMKNFTEDQRILTTDLTDGSSFFDYFWMHCEPYHDLLEVHHSALNTDNDKFDLPDIEWEKREIGILVMDFGDDRAANEAMWRVFSPSFLSDNTIIVFNQYGNARATALREFCAERSRELIAIHKPIGSAKAFRYKTGTV
jgi:hypothetical protein